MWNVGWSHVTSFLIWLYLYIWTPLVYWSDIFKVLYPWLISSAAKANSRDKCLIFMCSSICLFIQHGRIKPYCKGLPVKCLPCCVVAVPWQIYVYRSACSSGRFSPAMTQITTIYQNFWETEAPVCLVLTIFLSDTLKIVNVRSALVLQNKMEIPLEIKLKSPETDKENRKTCLV